MIIYDEQFHPDPVEMNHQRYNAKCQRCVLGGNLVQGRKLPSFTQSSIKSSKNELQKKKTMRNGNIIIKLNSILQQWFEAFRTILLWRSNLSFYGFSRNVQWCFSVSLVFEHESTDILMTIGVPEFPQSAFQQPLRKQPGGDLLFQGQILLWSLYLGLN